MDRVLVTGGFGFIGGHLLEVLLQGSASVHVVDDMSTSPVPMQALLDELSRSARSKLTFDLCTVESYFRDNPAKFDRVYHLASPVGPAGVLDHGGEMVRRIVDDTYLIVDHLLATGGRLLDVSTSEVYGGGQEGLCREDAPKIVPANTTIRLEYAVAKLAAETAIINKTRVAGLDAVIVRPFNVAGPRQSPVGGFVLPRFLRQADAGDPLTVFGDGSALRAFTHVKDLVKGIAIIMDQGVSGTAYNLGNPANRISILGLAQLVIKMVQSSSEISFVDPKEIYGPLYEEANDKFPDASRAMLELGWLCDYDIRSTVEDALTDYMIQKSSGSALES